MKSQGLFGEIPCKRTSLWRGEQPCEEAKKLHGQWVVSLPDKEAWEQFIKKHAPIIIDTSKDGFDIEIYDDYRE